MKKDRLFISINVLSIFSYSIFVFISIFYKIHIVIFLLLTIFILMIMVNKLKFKENSLKVYGTEEALYSIVLQHEFEIKYNKIKAYTIDDPKIIGVDLEEPLTNPGFGKQGFYNLFIVDVDNKLYRITLNRYSRKQMNKILNELNLRTGIEITGKTFFN